MSEVAQSSVFKLTGEQREAAVGDLLRRLARQKKLYRRCPSGNCRRSRTCAAADRSCLCIGSLPPMSNKDRKRLKHDVRHPRLDAS
jgi:hypothetical protein